MSGRMGGPRDPREEFEKLKAGLETRLDGLETRLDGLESDFQWLKWGMIAVAVLVCMSLLGMGIR